MSRNRPRRQPSNLKNGVHGGVDIPKRQAQQMESGCRYGSMPKWHVDSGTCYIPRTRSVLLIEVIIIFTFAASGGSDGGFPTGIVADCAPESHVVKDLIDRDYNADPPLPDFTLSDDGADASANSVLAAIADPILRRTGQRIGGAKNVVCQQMSRSMRKLSSGRK